MSDVEIYQPGESPASTTGTAIAVSPFTLIERAMDKGMGVEIIEKMIELQERTEATAARRAFNMSMASAKRALPEITKSRHVSYANKGGGVTDYWHEDLAGIAKQIDPILTEAGLSYRFRTEQNGGIIRVTCIVSHELGHFEETALEGSPDTSGGKNSIQAVGSAVTYLQRYTLKAALGLSSSKDDDAQGASGPATISAEQFIQLRDRIDEAGLNDEIVCKAEGIPSLEQTPTREFARIMSKLETTIANRNAKK